MPVKTMAMPRRVGGGDHFVIADGAPGLNHGDGAGFCGFFDAVGEREKRVGCDNASCERRPLRLHHGELHGIDTAHLARAHAERRAVSGEDDGVGFNMFANFPGEAHGLHFGGGGGALGHGP